jgi:TolB-like protein
MNKLPLILSLFICSCSTVPKYLSFDDALETGMQKIESDLPEGSQVAILDFKSDNENLSSYIIEEMYDKMVNFGKLVIMERSRTDTIAMEVDYQFSGEVDDNQIINIGHQLGADYVITGQITFSGEVYRLRVFAIDIEKGRRVASSSLDINPNDKQINHLITTGTENDINIRDSKKQANEYKIGDIGPAGGIVFYDKGVFANGWRYLEAAPHDIGPVQWGVFGVWIGTDYEVGTGKTNTQRIVEKLKQHGEIDRAAELCVVLNINGYEDWFLPSIRELILLYNNLYQKGLNRVCL